MILAFLLVGICTVPLTARADTFPPMSASIFVTIANTTAAYFVGGRFWALLVLLPSVIAIGMLASEGYDPSLHDHVIPGFIMAGANVIAAITMAHAALSRKTHGEARLYFGAASYLLIGIAFATIHQRIAVLDPWAYRVPGTTAEMPLGHWVDYLWFSFATLTTSGFADMCASSSWARLACTLEAITGIMFPAIFLARLVSAASEDTAEEKGTT